VSRREPRGAARDPRPDGGPLSLLVNETYRSIQGEGPLQGLPTFIIRLTGCNLRCRYCDTRYAYFEGERRSVAGLLEGAKESGARQVLVTGGEPLAQSGTPLLCGALLEDGFGVSLETNGSYIPDRLPPDVVKVVDVKTPGSGEDDSFAGEILELLGPRDSLKFVLTDRDDFEWARAWLLGHTLPAEPPEVLFLPVWERLDVRDLACWILETGLHARLQVPLHRVLWGSRRHV